jgi:hypothetical protein
MSHYKLALLAEIKGFLREYQGYLSSKQLNDLDEVDKFLELQISKTDPRRNRN